MAVAGLIWSQRSSAQAPYPGMIVRAKRPEDLETASFGIGEFLTPNDRFFVRTHTTVPDVDLASWQLQIDGQVATPATLRLSDIQRMPSAEVVGVLECAGNGRRFYEPPVAGLAWTHGAVGNARWKGVRLRDVLARCGIKPDAVEVLFDGADVPLGTMPDFQRSIPVTKALHPDTLLAYEMNGEPLPVKHGFPLRVIVPGWAGNSWVKWVRSVRVLNEKAAGFWMKSAYLQPAGPVPPGATVSADAMIPVTRLRIKSMITNPSVESRIDAGRTTLIHGVAWNGDEGRVIAVDVSTDSGRSWKSARLVGPTTTFGWRLWEFSWKPERNGFLTILARARNSRGDTQPLVPEWNPSGYLWNAGSRVDVHVGTSPVSTAPEAPSIPPAPQVFTRACTSCHEDDVVRQQRLTRAQWERELTKMTNWGAAVNANEREALLDYLVRLAGPVR